MARRLPYLIALLPLAAVLAAYARTDHFFANQYDDTYITYRYAIQLAKGHGLVFNVGEHTDAASSLLYTLLLSAGFRLGVSNLEWLGAALGCVSLLALCINVYWLALKLSGDPWVSALCCACCGLNGFLSGWTLSGMETLPWAAIVLLSLSLMIANASELAIAVAVLAAALTRFEGIFLVAPQLVRLFMRRDPARSYLPAVGAVLAFAAVYVAKHSYYDVWISHAFQMKELAAYYQADPGELLANWRRFAWLPVLLSVYGLLRREQRPTLLYLSLSVGSLLLGPRSDWSRYSVHLLPVFYAFAAVALHEIRIRHRYLGHVALLAIAALMLRQALRGHDYNLRNMVNLAPHQQCRRKLGQYIHDHIPPNEYIASADLGTIAYVALSHRFVDLLALTSADVLDAYAHQQTADQVLIDKRVVYLADTFRRNANEPLPSLLAQFPRVKDRPRFVLVPEKPPFRCSVNGGALQFNLARITRQPSSP